MVLLATQPAAACARDGVPSLSADGRLVALNRTTAPTTLATWTPFIVLQMLRHGHPVVLAEDNRQVARALPHSVFTYPWRWEFDDGGRPAYGTRVQHVFHRAGSYRLTVSAYFSSYRAWLPFDDATLRVQ